MGDRQKLFSSNGKFRQYDLPSLREGGDFSLRGFAFVPSILLKGCVESSLALLVHIEEVVADFYEKPVEFIFWGLHQESQHLVKRRVLYDILRALAVHLSSPFFRKPSSVRITRR